jgi:hypothetical protein
MDKDRKRLTRKKKMLYKDDNGQWYVRLDHISEEDKENSLPATKLEQMTEEGEKILNDIKTRREQLENGNGHGSDTEKFAKNTREAIDLKRAEGNIQIALTRATESSKEVAGKHLAKAGAVYLMILVLAFIYSIQALPNESVAVVAGLITLVVTNISGILKGITETKEAKDPIELMYDIADKNSTVCEREMSAQSQASKAQVEAITQAAERQAISIAEASERQLSTMTTAHSNQHGELVTMLKDALKNQPTSLSIRPDDVVIKQGDNEVKTSTKPPRE